MKPNQLNIENTRILADTFYLLSLQSPRGRVAMYEQYYHSCGTVACHAGWFGIANSEGVIEGVFTEPADQMAHFLGFSNIDVLRTWATNNPRIWGNEFGRWMFTHPIAFGKRNKVTLRDIAMHWYRVADRAEKAGSKK